MKGPRRPDCYVIGLTGNIATGKSTVDAILKAKGAVIVDADALVHQLERKGQPAWQSIVERFGRGVLAEDGELDRGKLGSMVFGDPGALRDLEAIVHPAVHAEIERLMNAAPAGSVLVYDAIKLLEGGMAANCDSVWVVTCRPEQQEQRLVRQRGLTLAAARQRIAAQGPQDEKVRRADVVIDNSGTVEETQRQVDAAWGRTAGAWSKSAQRAGGV